MSRSLPRAPTVVAVGLIALLSACAPERAQPPPLATAAPLPGGLAPAASILDLMLDPIDSSADFLWEAVATISTASGTEERQPRTDAEWAVLKQKALALMEAANLLVIEGRVVARPGQQLVEPDGTQDLTPAQAQAEIDKDRAAFVGFARALQVSAGEIVSAIDKRDIEAYLHAGGSLDEVCEGCHRRYWYPDSPPPPTQ
jgi:hypothetical protein